ncbi:MAG: tol-pal system protein YbgF [Pseudomonadota bacterium]
MGAKQVGSRVGLAVLLAALAGCVTMPAEDDPVLLKIGEMESRLRALESRLDNEGMVSVVGELQRLQEEVRQLRGDVEVTRNDMSTLEQNQRNMFVQIDDRVRAVESVPPSLAGAPAAGGVSASAPNALASPLSDSELYDRGFDQLKQQQYEQARETFAELVRTQPDSTLAGSAQYWYGETFYVRRDFETARAAFSRVLQDYPRSNKVADAQLKLGFCQYELAQWSQARATLEEVIARFSGTNAARLAADRLDRMQQEGR